MDYAAKLLATIRLVVQPHSKADNIEALMIEFPSL